MKKSKIAISLDKPLLDSIDSKVDGAVIRSRSQAIEFFLRRGLQDQAISTAVILLKGEHQKYSLKEIKGTSLIKNQLDFLYAHGIKKAFIVTQHTNNANLLLNEASSAKLSAEIIEKEAKGNANALFAIRDKLKESFVVMSGDIFNNFDLAKMAKKHIAIGRLATMGLMTREKPSQYGTAILDGDFIVDFQEKPLHYTTHIVNAGIYIFKPEIFELFENVSSLEKGIFPKLARINQLAGFFTYGEYVHLSN